MTVFLCIDLMGGKAVQLVQGIEKRVEVDDVMKLAAEITRLGDAIDVIDLDAAMGKGDNLSIIKELCSKYRCRVGGGIRTVERAKEMIDMGAEKVIIGTSAFKEGKIDTEFLSTIRDKIGRERVIVAIDSKDGKIVVKGWQDTTDIDTMDVVKQLEMYCSEIFYTYVDKEGMMQGTDFETVKRIRERVDIGVTAAGGISNIEEIRKLADIGVNSVVGMAYYTGKITMDELLELKNSGVI